MSKVDELKPLADRFAVTWCYDWGGGRLFIDGQADAIEKTDPDIYEIKTSTWALNIAESELELSREIHRLIEQELCDDVFPMGMGDPAPGEFVDVEQWFYPLFGKNSSILDVVPEGVLKEAVELYFDAEDRISDYFTEDDPFAYVLPHDLHPVVHSVIKRLCSEEAKKLRDEDAVHEIEIRRFDLILETDPPVRVQSGQIVEGLRGLNGIGKGVALLNGMPQDGSAGSHRRASIFKEWIESKKSLGHLVTTAKGVFAGKEVDGVLAVAVFDLSLHEAETAVESTQCGLGLFIGEHLIPQFIRR
jgi:hypothetical protein